LNGSRYDKAFLRHADLVAGGTLTFEMGPKPNHRWASASSSMPYSLSNER
jgi:putative alpha-1,2-mannosidase